MAQLQKNQKIPLHNVTNLLVGLGWQTDSAQTFDLDASAYMLTQNCQIRDRKDFVYYNNLHDNLGILTHSGDNVVGGEGDCEQITVRLDKVPTELAHITFVVTIHDAIARQQTFGQVKNAYIRLCHLDTGEEICRYQLGLEFIHATSIVFGDIVRLDNQWFFDAVGVAFSGGLNAIAQDFDLKLADK
jgi:tellurium resistance protein TerD